VQGNWRRGQEPAAEAAISTGVIVSSGSFRRGTLKETRGISSFQLLEGSPAGFNEVGIQRAVRRIPHDSNTVDIWRTGDNTAQRISREREMPRTDTVSPCATSAKVQLPVALASSNPTHVMTEEDVQSTLQVFLEELVDHSSPQKCFTGENVHPSSLAS
jgi:hypothetical protein